MCEPIMRTPLKGERIIEPKIDSTVDLAIEE
jgi:hypothetical protein